jgi:predicted N-acetyltransferase YhbS
MIALRLEQPEDAAAVRAVHRLAFGGPAEEGFAAVVVGGHPGYYPRFGFLPASRWGMAGVRGIMRFRQDFTGV